MIFSFGHPLRLSWSLVSARLFRDVETYMSHYPDPSFKWIPHFNSLDVWSQLRELRRILTESQPWQTFLLLQIRPQCGPSLAYAINSPSLYRITRTTQSHYVNWLGKVVLSYGFPNIRLNLINLNQFFQVTWSFGILINPSQFIYWRMLPAFLV